MLFVGVISETLLYFCFATLLGSFILHTVPKDVRPEIVVPRKVLFIAIMGVALLSFIQPLRLILAFYKEIGLSLTVQSVIFTFEIGKAWLLTVFFSIILFIYLVLFDIRKKTSYSYVGIIITIGLIVAVGWASHASSQVGFSGFITHSFHFLAVSTWIGILLIVGWFSTNQNNWLNFLKWFSPVAVICLLITMGTGLFLMNVVVEFKDYASAWKLTYGQALLLKHILIIPLLTFAFINSILIRKRLKNVENFNPRPWTKVESLVVLFIFVATSVLGQTSPPHNIASTLAMEGPAKLFDLLYSGSVTRELDVVLAFGVNSISLMVLAVLFIGLTIIAFMKRAPAILSFIISVLSVITIYLSLMFSIQ